MALPACKGFAKPRKAFSQRLLHRGKTSNLLYYIELKLGSAIARKVKCCDSSASHVEYRRKTANDPKRTFSGIVQNGVIEKM
jgi:hypothetical protein